MLNSFQQPLVKKIPTISVLLLGFLACSCSTRETTRESGANVPNQAVSATMSEVASTTPIRKGDQIQMSVWGYPEFTTNATVKETGTIVIPLIGEVLVSGLTRDQFSDMLRQRLSEYVKGEVKLTINIVSTAEQKISVFGAVNRLGTASMTGEVSLLDLLIGAGGFTEDSDLEHIKIWRAADNREPIEVNLNSYLDNGNIRGIPILHPGDTVFVPKRDNVVRDVTGFMQDLFYLFGFFTLLR
jgi:protein involved in polysaccharide export with SLBB domain